MKSKAIFSMWPLMMFFVAAGIIGWICSCNSTPAYKFTYSVDVDFTDGTSKTLVGTTTMYTDEPENVQFTLSSRLRPTPCLLLDEDLMDPVNIACGVKSFTANKLEYARK